MKIKKLISLLLTSLLMLSMIPRTVFTASAADRDVTFVKNAGNTQFGTGGIGYPRSSLQYNPNHDYGGQWSYVWYGKYNGKPLKFRVLDKASNAYGVEGGSMLLDCDNVLKQTPFNDEQFTPEASLANSMWANSTVKSWLNGSEFLNNTDCFTEAEHAAIAPSYRADGYTNAECEIQPQPLTGEKLFILDQADVSVAAYGYINDNGNTNSYHAKSRLKTDMDGNVMGWWMRTFANVGKINDIKVYSVMCIGGGNEAENSYFYGAFLGTFAHDDYFKGPIGISPAMNISPSSILFTTSIADKEFKLTLKDPSLSVSLQPGQSVTRNGGDVTVPYTVSGDADCLSLLITDKDLSAGGSIRYYGTVKTENIGSDGSVTFTLPSNCSMTDKVYIIAEKTNGAHETDYASELYELDMPSFSVTFDACGGTVSPASLQTGTNGRIEYLPTPSNGGLTFMGWFTEDDGGDKVPSGNVFSSDTTLYAHWVDSAVNVYYVDESGEIVIPDLCKKIEYDSGLSKLTLTSGWYTVTEDTTIGVPIEVSGAVNLILCDGVTLTASKGIIVAAGQSLTVYGQSDGTGELNATGGNNGSAAIGGKTNIKAGKITINGGVIEAYGAIQAAAIGSGCFGSGAEIVINGGTVTARGNEMLGAGIGGGDNCGANTVTINGGVVTAYGGTDGAGIGSGQKGNAGTVTINGGTVTANGGYPGGAGIGGGNGASGADVTINGGTVTAYGEGYGAGIGSGEYNGRYGPVGGGNLVINGGRITAIEDRGYSIGPGTYDRRKGIAGNLTVNLTNEGDFLDAKKIKANVTLGAPAYFASGDYDDGAVTPESLTNKDSDLVLRPGKTSAGVRIAENDVTLTYGAEPFSLTGFAESYGSDGEWTWTSSDPYVADVTGCGPSAAVRANGVGTAEVTAFYESDIIKGSASVTVTVERGEGKALPQVVRSVETTDQSFSVDLSGVIPYDIGQITGWEITGDPVCTGGVSAANVKIGGADSYDPGLITGVFSNGQAGDTVTVAVKVTAENYDCYLDAVVTLICTEPVEHDVRVTYNGADGTVSTDRISALTGETVIVYAEPDLGCTLDSITVTDEDGDTITVTDGQFIMPDSEVSVTASFTRFYSYDRTSKELTLVSGEYNKTERWSVEVLPGDVTSVSALPGVRFVGDCSGMFNGFSNCEEFDLSALDTSTVTNMNYMFYGCRSVKTLDLSAWDTSSVKKMLAMFAFCKSATDFDLAGLVTPSVTNINNMFDGCISLENIDFTGWDTSNVTGMSSMFFECTSLKTVDISGFNTTSVNEMMDMFTLCTSLEEVELGSLDLSNVEYLTGMFEMCESLTGIDLSGADLSSVLYADCMFSGCTSLESVSLDGADTSSLLSIEEMFRDCTSLVSVDLSDVDTSDVYSMSGIFRGCTALENVTLAGCDTSSLYDSSNMFMDCESLTSLDLSTNDLGMLENANSMFSGCSALTDLELPELGDGLWDASFMFKDCASITTLDLTSAGTDNLQMAGGMFSGCTALESVVLPALGASLFDTNYMFENCESLTEIELSGNITNDMLYAEGMFSGCTSLVTADLSGLEAEIADSSMMFFGCTALTEVDISKLDIVTSGDDAAEVEDMFLGCDSLRDVAFSPNTVVSDEMSLKVIITGDVNDDGLITLQDLSALKAYLAGVAGATANDDNSDINGDGLVTIADVGAIKILLA